MATIQKQTDVETHETTNRQTNITLTKNLYNKKKKFLAWRILLDNHCKIQDNRTDDNQNLSTSESSSLET